MSVEGIGGAGGVSGQISEVIKGIGETNDIVRNIFQELEKFKNKTDKEIGEALERTKQRLTEMLKKVADMNPQEAKALVQELERLNVNVEKLQSNLSLSISPETSRAFSDVQTQINRLLEKLEV